MTAWQFALGARVLDDPEEEASKARARRVRWRLTEPSEASFTIDGHDAQAELITELVTDLHVYRDGRRLYRGRVGPTQDVVDGRRHTVTVPTGDYRGVLRRRILYDTDQLAWTATDQAAIALGLIDQTQAHVGGDLGITAGLGASTGVARDRTYEPGKAVFEAVQQLSEVINGFDWDIDPDSRALDIYYPQRGENRGVVLDLGGLVTGFTRDVDPSTYANANRVNGDDTVTAEVREATDLATRPEGRWDAQHGYTTISEQATLDERANWQIEQDQLVVPTYTVRLKKGRWEGPDHVWLGDPCKLVLPSGRLAVDTVLRVYEIAVDIDDNGTETVDVTLGGPRPDPRRLATDQLVRLDQLERR